MELVTRTSDKAGVLGVIVSAIGCASCFPAIASLGSAIGLGFLSQYEGLFIRVLLPAFAALALVANVIAWRRHRQWLRGLLGIVGPVLALAAVFLMRAYGWSSGVVLYPGLVLMVAVSVWDLVSPVQARCSPTGRELPQRP